MCHGVFASLAPMRAPSYSSLGNVTFLRGATLLLDVMSVTVHSPSSGMTRRYAVCTFTGITEDMYFLMYSRALTHGHCMITPGNIYISDVR